MDAKAIFSQAGESIVTGGLTMDAERDRLWELFGTLSGCKPNKKDCSAKRCNNWGSCEVLIEGLLDAGFGDVAAYKAIAERAGDVEQVRAMLCRWMNEEKDEINTEQFVRWLLTGEVK